MCAVFGHYRLYQDVHRGESSQCAGKFPSSPPLLVVNADLSSYSSIHFSSSSSSSFSSSISCCECRPLLLYSLIHFSSSSSFSSSSVSPSCTNLTASVSLSNIIRVDGCNNCSYTENVTVQVEPQGCEGSSTETLTCTSEKNCICIVNVQYTVHECTCMYASML